MGSLKVDRDFFAERLKKVYELWNGDEDETLSKLNCLCFVFGDNVSDYSKSQSLQTWLFNCSLADTLLVMTKDHVYFLGSDKKAQFFAPVASDGLGDDLPSFSLLKRDKDTKDKNNFETLLNVMKETGDTFGFFSKEKCDTDFGKSWESALNKTNLEGVEVALSFALLFAVKDKREIALIRKSSEATVNAWNFLRKKFINIVNAEKNIRHDRLSDDVDKSVVSVPVQGPLAQNQALETCYVPIIQSGSQCSLKFSVESNDKNLNYGSMMGCLGLRYMSYCTNVARTMVVDPTDELKEVYEVLLTAHNVLLDNLKPGNRVCDAYAAVMDHIKSTKPDIWPYIVKSSFGFVTGIQFREPLLLISEKCKQEVKENMTFIVALGAQNFENPQSNDKEAKKVSIMLSDTVLITEDVPEVLTAKAKIAYRSNCMRIRLEEEVEVQPVVEALTSRAARSLVLQEQTRHKETNEEKRREHQMELVEKLNKDARARLSHASGKENAQVVKKSNVSYKGIDRFPSASEVNEGMIYVDKRHDTVLLPIFGMPVPFHISMLKNTSMANEGDYTYLRLNFTHPGSQIGKDNLQFPNPLADFVKEMTFRSSNSKEPGEMHPPSLNLSTAYRLIKEMQKRFRTLEAEEREKEGAVKQDKLVLTVNKGNPKLKELYVRPNIIAKRVSGFLEAHQNGFRYTTLRSDKIDVLYNNIKHAFFQPCNNEMIILLHFHLKNPVLWGKKKYSDIQFYTEVGEITTDLSKYHHMQDRDDMASEQLEREMRKKLNAMFQSFCDKVTKATNEAVDFDMPFPDLAFDGVPYRSNVSLKPTSSCLVNLTEWPPFVVTLDEVELVHFERVTGNTRSFDMVIVFKDYHKKTQTISHIPGQMLDGVKEWLNSCDIRYSEGPISLNWNNIMKTIVQDPEQFFEDGGWNFLLSDTENDEEEEESEESDFQPTDESDASDEDESEDSESGDATEESESEASLESDESSGKDWSDLEEEAAKADRAKERGELEEGGSSHHKRKGDRRHSHGGPSAKRRR